MANRKNKKRRRQGIRDYLGRCEAAECPLAASRRVFIPDDEREHSLCEPHARAVETQIQRNRDHAAGEQRRVTEERLGLR